MKRKITLLLTVCQLVMVGNIAFAQESTIPVVRQSFHDNIDIDQKRILNLDKKQDDLFTPSANNEELNKAATHAAIEEIDSLQKVIEADNYLDNNNKMKFLRGLDELLKSYRIAYEYKNIKGAQLHELLQSYGKSMDKEKYGESYVPVLLSSSFEVATLLSRNFAFRQNVGQPDVHQLLIAKEFQTYPDKPFTVLGRNLDYVKADSVIAALAQSDPDAIYTYARATDKLGEKIRNNPNLLVHTIVSMANKQNGRQYFPFLDNLYRGKISLSDIDAQSENSVDYYKLLVATAIEYAERTLQKDTPMAMDALNVKIKATADTFINSINGLHENTNLAVRFKAIEPLNPQELYYLAISGEEELYTSSYLFGVYPQIFQKGGKNFTADSLLMSVYFDHFKKWLKMAANYNRIDDFLKKMDKNNADVLMRQFVRNLDKNTGKNSLEDAVDVAGSYASINDRGLRALILDEVHNCLTEAQESKNVKATDIYYILEKLFMSLDPANHIDLSKDLGIPPVYSMPIDNLKNGSGRIVVQQFFYGDKDGATGFGNFMNAFSGAGWKVTNTPEWTVVSSTVGAPISIYSNRPLDENKGLDDKAQEDLNQYLSEKSLAPTIVIHRGHSYYLNSTIKQLAPSAKVVMLGSCGGYQSLSDVLHIAPEAHIISSRQTGTGIINLSLISAIFSDLKSGKSLNWVEMWKSLSQKLGKTEEFSDYVPPYSNLGAVFLTAYDRAQKNKTIE